MIPAPTIIRPRYMAPIDMVGFGRGGGAPPAPTFPKAANLQGSWDLFGGDSVQTDNSGNGNDLSPTGTPGQSVGGGPDGVDCAELVRSQNESYQLADASATGLSPGSGDFAGCIWFKASSLDTYQVPMGKFSDASNGEWYLIHHKTAQRFEFIAWHSEGGVSVYTATNSVVGSWYFLQFYIDTTNQEIGIAHNDNTFDTAAFTEAVRSSTAPFTVGERGDTGYDHLDGLVAIAHIWNAIPTSAEWTELYNGGQGLRYTP